MPETAATSTPLTSSNIRSRSRSPVALCFLTLALAPALLAEVSLSVSPPGGSVFGSPVTVTATVTPADAAGKVTFYDGTTILGTSAVSSGSAAMTTILLPAGTSRLRARYLGDGVHAASTSSTIAHRVGARPATFYTVANRLAFVPERKSFVVADFNCDSKADLAVTVTHGIAVLLGNGDGTFQPAVTYTTGYYAARLVTADFDGDGKADLGVLDTTLDSSLDDLGILLGNGDGTFRPITKDTVPELARAMVVADVNSDGKPDLLIGAGTQLQVHLGRGDGSFQPPLALYTGNTAISIATADFNEDGRPDIVMPGGGTAAVIFLGNGDGTFQPRIDYNVGYNPYWVVTADLNDDAHADFVITNSYGFDGFSVGLGNGDGTFRFPQGGPLLTETGPVQTGDFNGDGVLDLVISGKDYGPLRFLFGTGTGAVQSGPIYEGDATTGPVVVADFNGDGRADLVTADRFDSFVNIWLADELAMTSSGSQQSTVVRTPFVAQLQVKVTDTAGKPKPGVTVIFSVPRLGASATLSSNTAVTDADGLATVTATANAMAGVYTVTAAMGSLSASFELTNVNWTVPPVISTSGGVVSGASYQAGIGRNAWITIWGTNLCQTTDNWAKSINNGGLPTNLSGVSVRIGGLSAYVQFVSPTQINALAPSVPPGNVLVTVTNDAGTSSSVPAVVNAFQPAFFQWGSYAVATREDFTYAVKNGALGGAATVPAKPGDVIILWGTGFGPTTPAPPQGWVTPASPTFYTSNPVSVTVGDVPATVYGAALAPSYAGLYQVAIQIPPSLADGDYPVIATVAGASSPSTTLITVEKQGN